MMEFETLIEFLILTEKNEIKKKKNLNKIISIQLPICGRLICKDWNNSTP